MLCNGTPRAVVRAMRRTLSVVGIGIMLVGCSAAVRRHRGQTPPTCTSSRGLPAADFLAAGILLAAPVVWSAATYPGLEQCETTGCSWSEFSPGKGMVAGAIFAAPFLASGTIGWVRTSRCRAAVAEHDARDPLAGAEGHACRAGACDAGLVCERRRCAKEFPARGEACRGGIEGVPHAGVCASGLFCRNGTCTSR
jgi:hypothetical protein